MGRPRPPRDAWPCPEPSPEWGYHVTRDRRWAQGGTRAGNRGRWGRAGAEPPRPPPTVPRLHHGDGLREAHVGRLGHLQLGPEDGGLVRLLQPGQPQLRSHQSPPRTPSNPPASLATGLGLPGGPRAAPSASPGCRRRQDNKPPPRSERNDRPRLHLGRLGVGWGWGSWVGGLAPTANPAQDPRAVAGQRGGCCPSPATGLGWG